MIFRRLEAYNNLHNVKRKLEFPQLYLLLLILLLHFPSNNAYLYVENQKFAVLPAFFGRHLDENENLSAQLVFLPENENLCEYPSQANATEYIMYTSTDPMLVLASRGECSFAQKASVAKALHPLIKAVAVQNDMDSDHDVLFPMHSKSGNTDLIMVSISHASGQALKELILRDIHNTSLPLLVGGPKIQIDPQPLPKLIIIRENIRSVLLVLLTFAYVLVVSGTTVAALAWIGMCIQFANGGDFEELFDSPILGGDRSRKLLTRQEVLDMSKVLETKIPDENNQHNQNEEEEDVCPVCIDILSVHDGRSVTILPCRHQYHTTCIIPWMTAHNSKCPLCKFDVYEHVRGGRKHAAEKIKLT